MLKEVLLPGARVLRVEPAANGVMRAKPAVIQKKAGEYFYLRDFPSNRYGPVGVDDKVPEFIQGSPNRQPTFIVMDTEENRAAYGLKELARTG